MTNIVAGSSTVCHPLFSMTFAVPGSEHREEQGAGNSQAVVAELHSWQGYVNALGHHFLPWLKYEEFDHCPSGGI